MESVAGILRITLAVVGLWTLASILVAFPVGALFRAQARRETMVRQAERRQVWLEAAR